MTAALTRHQIRERAFQALFAINANPDANHETLYEQLLVDDSETPVEVPEYLRELVDGVLEQRVELDNQIGQYLMSGWTLSRIAKADLIILRIAFYEMNHQDDIPRRAVVNEALELAKEFSDDKSRRFINGVLSNEIKAE